MGSISSYNFAGLISEVSEEVATQIAKNCRGQQPHSHLRSPPIGTPRVSAYALYFQKLESLVYILSLHVWVYLHANLHSGLQKTHLFCNRVRFGRSRSSKVDDFGINRKRICDFLFVPYCDYGPILHHFWDTATYWLNIAYFSYPLSFGALTSYVLFGISC